MEGKEKDFSEEDGWFRTKNDAAKNKKEKLFYQNEHGRAGLANEYLNAETVVSGNKIEDLEADKACVKDVFEQFLAGLYLENCDKLKYGEFSCYLSSQYGLNHDQYPKTLTAAHTALATVKIDQAYWDKQRQKKKGRTGGSNPSQGDNESSSQQGRPAKVVDARDSDTVSEMTYAQFKRHKLCYVCGDKNCSAKTCPK